VRFLSRLLIILIIAYSIGFPLSIAYTKSRAILFPENFRSLIGETAKRYNFDPLFIAALTYAESSFKPGAVSKSGAVGLMQIMPDTGRQLAKELKMENYSQEKLQEPSINLELGCYFLSKLNKEFKDFEKILMAYNAGRGNLLKWQESGEPLNNAFPETRNYVSRIRKVYRILKILDGIQSF
jgi:soluble lytic murein transglycosylase